MTTKAQRDQLRRDAVARLVIDDAALKRTVPEKT